MESALNSPEISSRLASQSNGSNGDPFIRDPTTYWTRGLELLGPDGPIGGDEFRGVYPYEKKVPREHNEKPDLDSDGSIRGGYGNG